MSFISSGCSHEKTLQVRGSPSFPNGGETALVLADRDAVDGKAYSGSIPIRMIRDPGVSLTAGVTENPMKRWGKALDFIGIFSCH